MKNELSISQEELERIKNGLTLINLNLLTELRKYDLMCIILERETRINYIIDDFSNKLIDKEKTLFLTLRKEIETLQKEKSDLKRKLLWYKHKLETRKKNGTKTF